MRRTTRADYNCSFCGKTQNQVQRLIAGPRSVFVCDECIARAGAAAPETNGESCSFCGKTQSQIQTIYRSANRVAICNECVSLCQEIISDEISRRAIYRADQL